MSSVLATSVSQRIPLGPSGVGYLGVRSSIHARRQYRTRAEAPNATQPSGSKFREVLEESGDSTSRRGCDAVWFWQGRLAAMEDPANKHGDLVSGGRLQAPKREGRIKLLFAVVILWQFLQLGVTRRFGEPYPALTMPSFAGTMVDRDGNIRLTNVKCKVSFKDGRVEWLTAHELLSEAPGSNRMPIMGHMFSRPPAVAEPWPPRTLKGRLFPGRALARARQTQQELDPETKGWLKDRTKAIYPSQEPTVVTFIWYESVFNTNQASLTATHEVTGIREVRLQ